MSSTKVEHTLSHEQACYYLHLGQDQLAATEQVELDSHLANCPDCRRYAGEVAALQTRLAEAMRLYYKTYQPSPDINRQVQARLRRKIRSRQLWRLTNSVMAAAVLLILVVALGWLAWRIRPLPNTPVANITLTAPVPAADDWSALPGLAIFGDQVGPLLTGTPPPRPSPAPTATPNPIPASCPVTLPNGNTPPGEQPSPTYHGNGLLWTALWPDGLVLIPPQMVQPDGTLSMKWGWWRGVNGPLTITGRRLDAPASPLDAVIPDGYGDTGFQAGGLIFPTEGCWEVTGQVGDSTLTFVTWVVKTSGN